MPVIPSQIPPPSSRTKTRPDYDEIREIQSCRIDHGLTKSDARKLAAALNTGDYFACVR
jgi:hypothetical protein